MLLCQNGQKITLNHFSEADNRRYELTVLKYILCSSSLVQQPCALSALAVPTVPAVPSAVPIVHEPAASPHEVPSDNEETLGTLNAWLHSYTEDQKGQILSKINM